MSKVFIDIYYTSMKTYHTSIGNMAMLFAVLFCFLVLNSANAQNCGFSTHPQLTDSVGNSLTITFSADPTGQQIHEILITNTSGASLALNFSLKYSTNAGVSWTIITMPGNSGDLFTIDRFSATITDTLSVYPVFNANAAAIGVL